MFLREGECEGGPVTHANTTHAPPSLDSTTCGVFNSAHREQSRADGVLPQLQHMYSLAEVGQMPESSLAGSE